MLAGGGRFLFPGLDVPPRAASPRHSGVCGSVSLGVSVPSSGACSIAVCRRPAPPTNSVVKGCWLVVVGCVPTRTGSSALAAACPGTETVRSPGLPLPTNQLCCQRSRRTAGKCGTRRRMVLAGLPTGSDQKAPCRPAIDHDAMGSVNHAATSVVRPRSRRLLTVPWGMRSLRAMSM